MPEPTEDVLRPRDDVKRLVERAATGDAEAVEDLLQRHLPRLRAWIRVKAGPELLALESSSDLAQSVCRDVLEHLGRFRYPGEGAFRKWLFTTALRKIADRHAFYHAKRRGQRRRESTGGDEAVLEAWSRSFTPSRHAAAREELARLEAALRALDEDKREVILLSRIVGLSHAGIAAEMGRSELATRKLLSRALAELAERMVRPQQA